VPEEVEGLRADHAIDVAGGQWKVEGERQALRSDHDDPAPVAGEVMLRLESWKCCCALDVLFCGSSKNNFSSAATAASCHITPGGQLYMNTPSNRSETIARAPAI
jgi:hypothetical protein